MIAPDTHLAIILAGLAAGETICEHVPADDDCMAMLGAMNALGARIRAGRNGATMIAGAGNGCLLQPGAPLALNSPDDALLVAGLVAPYDLATRVQCAVGLNGDAVASLLAAFAAMGIQAEAEGDGAIVFAGQATANPAIHDAGNWSEAVIAAIMLTALGTPGITRIDRLSRDPAALVEPFTRFGAVIDIAATDRRWSLAVTGQTDIRAPTDTRTQEDRA